MKRSYRMMRVFIWSWVLLLVLCIHPRDARGDDRATVPGYRPNTSELVPYKASGYKIQVIPRNTQPPRGFFQLELDDTAFKPSTAPFGAGSGGAGVDCPLRRTVHTEWPLETQLLVRRELTIPTGATNIRIMVSVDNDISGVFFNGQLLVERLLQTSRITHNNCPILDEFRFDVPESMVRAEKNVIAFHVQDRPPISPGSANESFFDAKVLADIPLLIGPQNLATLLRSIPLSPVPGNSLLSGFRNIPLQPVEITEVICDDQGAGGRLASLGFFVRATGELAELRIERRGESNVIVDYIIDGNLMYTSISSDFGRVAQFTRDFIARPPTPADQGLSAAGSVLARDEVMESVVTCLLPGSQVRSSSGSVAPSGTTPQALTLGFDCNNVCNKIGDGVCAGVAATSGVTAGVGALFALACAVAVVPACDAVCSDSGSTTDTTCKPIEDAAISNCSFERESFLTGFRCTPQQGSVPIVEPGRCDTCQMGTKMSEAACLSEPDRTFISFGCSGGDPITDCRLNP